jgi:hypothetical protein
MASLFDGPSSQATSQFLGYPWVWLPGARACADPEREDELDQADRR